MDAIKLYAPTYDPVEVRPPNRDGSMGEHPQTMVAVLTDTHVGERVSLNQMAGLNDYDLNKFSRRLSGWAIQVLNLATYRRNMCEVNELVVPLLGDIISGDIHEELSRSNVDNCMMQMLSAAHVISQALMYLAPHFESIRVPCVVGNHGRMTRKPPMKDNTWIGTIWYISGLLPFVLNNPTSLSRFQKHSPKLLRCVTVRYYCSMEILSLVGVALSLSIVWYRP